MKTALLVMTVVLMLAGCHRQSESRKINKSLGDSAQSITSDANSRAPRQYQMGDRGKQNAKSAQAAIPSNARGVDLEKSGLHRKIWH